jgi:hypothetical protein
LSLRDLPVTTPKSKRLGLAGCVAKSVDV